MNPISKKGSGNTRKAQSQSTKGLKRSKSTEYLVPKRSAKKNHLQREYSEETIMMSTLGKSKSAKSIKSKPKSHHKNESSSSKKARMKKLETKTVKKGAVRSSHEGSSILTEDWNIKKPNSEYFFYCNNYIPIENSAQRRLVYRIQMIDLENKSTVDSFNKSPPKNQSVGTELVETKSIAVGQMMIQSNHSTQTEKKIFDEAVDKCFVDVLTELEFLYLPNEANFEPFSQNERVHYGQMLQTLAKKMLSGCGSIVKDNFLTDEQITVLLYQREGIQVGALEYIPVDGFPTHLLAILAYLKNLFCFIEYNYKEEVISNIRKFYGYNYNERVHRLTKRLPHEVETKCILSENLFQAFQYEMFKDYEFPNEMIQEAVHIHNRALFDAVNMELQVFRPFYSSEGEPFPWSINLGMTHYEITEEALYIIFMQIKQKIQKQIVTLCGMHLDFDDQTLPKANLSPFYSKKMQDRIRKMVVEQAKTWDDSVAIDYEKTSLKFEVEEEIFVELVREIELEIIMMREEAQLNQCDLQYFF